VTTETVTRIRDDRDCGPDAVTADEPSISVIICTYAEARLGQLAAALQSVQDQRIPALETIVVVDHNLSLLQQVRGQWPGVVAIANHEARGLSGARNCGVVAARGEVVAFLDDDAVAAPMWLAYLRACYRDPLVAGAGGSIQPLWEEGRPAWFPREFDWVVGCTYRGMPTAPAPVRNLIGANMSFRRSLCLGAGGFRSVLGRVGASAAGCEETELCIRIGAERRWALRYEPRSIVYHQVPVERARWRYFTRRCFAEGRSKALVAAAVGTFDGLASERAYTAKVLPRACLQGLADALLQFDASGLARSSAIIGGLGYTMAGYLSGRLPAKERGPKHTGAIAQPSLEAPLRTSRVPRATARHVPENGVGWPLRGAHSRGARISPISPEPCSKQREERGSSSWGM
jgi:GT2 family glycosyltransferase